MFPETYNLLFTLAGTGSIVVEVSRVYNVNNMLSRIDVSWNPLVSYSTGISWIFGCQASIIGSCTYDICCYVVGGMA